MNWRTTCDTANYKTWIYILLSHSLLHEAEYFGITPLIRRITVCLSLNKSHCGNLLFHAHLPLPSKLSSSPVTLRRRHKDSHRNNQVPSMIRDRKAKVLTLRHQLTLFHGYLQAISVLSVYLFCFYIFPWFWNFLFGPDNAPRPEYNPKSTHPP